MDSTSRLTGSTKPSSAYRPVVITGAAVGLAIMGDSLLYNILPLEAGHLGISAALVGVLLSANRLVRLASNTGVSQLFERVGPRIPFVAATVLALITTAVYGVGWGFLSFLLARIGWGVAWSGLRQGGYQAVWAGGETARGRSMGVLWGTVRLGSASSVLLGGYLYDRFGYQVALGVVACITALALPVALSVRWPLSVPQVATAPLPGWRVAFGVSRQRWLLAAGFLHGALEGVLVSTLSLFLAGRLGVDESLLVLGVGVATVTGLLLAVRWLSGLLFGPALGALSDRMGQPRMAALLTGVLLAGVMGMVGASDGWLILCISLVFTAGAGLFVTLSAAANGIALRSDRPHRFVGVYTTAADAGLAIGPLLAYSLSSAIGLAPLYLAAASLLLLAVARYWRLQRSVSTSRLRA